MREKVSPSEITVRTEQGETGMTHDHERDVVARREAGDRGEREGEAAQVQRQVPERVNEYEKVIMEV